MAYYGNAGLGKRRFTNPKGLLGIPGYSCLRSMTDQSGWILSAWSLTDALKASGELRRKPTVVIIGIAAGITWTVVKLFPPKTAAEKSAARSSKT